jgi:hypothetical protein
MRPPSPLEAKFGEGFYYYYSLGWQDQQHPQNSEQHGQHDKERQQPPSQHVHQPPNILHPQTYSCGLTTRGLGVLRVVWFIDRNLLSCERATYLLLSFSLVLLPSLTTSRVIVVNRR